MSEKGLPGLTDVEPYRWIVWSGAGYETSGPDILDLPIIMEFLDSGGQRHHQQSATVFWPDRRPGHGDRRCRYGQRYPGTGCRFARRTGGACHSPAVSPLSNVYEGEEPDWVLRRGPASADADRPLAFVMTDEDSDDPMGRVCSSWGCRSPGCPRSLLTHSS